MRRIALPLPPAPLAWLMPALLGAACWWLTVAMSLDWARSGDAAMWQQAPFAMLLAMWAVMMAAMMLPSFVPTFLCYSRLLASKRASVNAPLHAALLTGGYLLLWAVFSAAAAALQQRAAAAGGLNDALAAASPLWCAALLAAAGAFQFTALKMKCLNGCRHPAFFFMLHWRGGARGALYMGAHSGLLCVGCCAWLMLLLFVGGVMNLYWIVLLALYALAEKTLPFAPQAMARAAGSVLLAAAAAQLFVR